MKKKMVIDLGGIKKEKRREGSKEPTNQIRGGLQR